MKPFIFLILFTLFFSGCGSNTTTTIDTYSSNLIEYSSDTNASIEANSSNEAFNDTTPLTSSLIYQLLEEQGYTVTPLSQTAALRGSLDYQTYLYLTTQESTIALWGEYVYALQDLSNRKILFTINGASEFDTIEKSPELILRANFLDESAKLRYTLSFAPVGYVNINTITTNPNATIGTLLAELHYAFNQLTLTNPQLTLNTLSYLADNQADNTYILCNGHEITLYPTQTSLDLSGYFSTQTPLINCTTANGVLIGSIYNPNADENITVDENETQEESIISGDLYRSIYSTTPQVEGSLLSNTPNVTFISTQSDGAYGLFTIESTGEWIYVLDTNNTTIQGLNGSQSLNEFFSVQTTDNTKVTITITIQGIDQTTTEENLSTPEENVTTPEVNQTTPEENVTTPETNQTTPEVNQTIVPTIISGDLNRSMQEITPQVSGMLYTNKEDITFIASSVDGVYGQFVLGSDGNWSYLLHTTDATVRDLNLDQFLQECFEVVTSDDTLEEVNITIQGIDTLIEGSTTFTIPKTYTLELNDTFEILYSSTTFESFQQGLYGTFTIDQNGSWSYDLNETLATVLALQENQTLLEHFNVSTTDGITQELNITITGSNSLIMGDLVGKVTKDLSLSASGKVYVFNGTNQFTTQKITTQYGSFELLETGEWSYTLNRYLKVILALLTGEELSEEVTIASVDNITATITITINGNSTALTIESSDFDALPSHIESMNNQNIALLFPIVSATGDTPIITYYLNGAEVEANSTITLLGAIENSLKVVVTELYDTESATREKIIQVSDTTPPLPPQLSYPSQTTQSEAQAQLTAFEDNVMIYVNGIYVETLADSTQQQTLTLDTSGTFGDKTFSITLKDIAGNESNATIITITTYNPNSATDFSGVKVENFIDDGIIFGGVLAGTITDADGITQVTISYDDNSSDEVKSATATTFTFPLYVYGEEHPFGTNFSITVIDNLGITSTPYTGTINEQDEPTETPYIEIFDNNGTAGQIAYLSINDPNGIEKVTITYPSGGTSWASPYLNGGSSSFYASIYSETLDEPELTYPFTYTITVLDSLDNSLSFTRTVNTPQDPTTVLTKVIDDNATYAQHLEGTITDPNGIDYISVYYSDTGTVKIEGNGAQSVSIDESMHDYNSTYDIMVVDMDGYYQYPDSGTFDALP